MFQLYLLITERITARYRNNEQQQETFELKPVQSHSRIIHVAPIHLEEQRVESLENSNLIQPIKIFEFIVDNQESEKTPEVALQH